MAQEDVAILGIGVDTSDVERGKRNLAELTAEGAKAERALENLGSKSKTSASNSKALTDEMKRQQQELGDLLGQINPTIAALGRLDEMERKLIRNKDLGLLDTDTFTEYKSRLDASRKALSDFDSSASRTGKTAKEMSAALRGVPAQFTDIFVSLQGGQAPLQVFLQQGGQLKDMFGGIGPAAKALGGYIAGLITPFTIGTAAVIGLTTAYIANAQEVTRFNNTLISSGNILGATTSQLREMSQEAGSLTGNFSTSKDAILALASNGKISLNDLELATRGVANAAYVTGREVSDLSKEFERLASNPSKELLRLNEQYNFLTADIYKQVVALEEQGKKQEAVTLAFHAFADAMESRKGQMQSSLVAHQSAWESIKKAIDGAKNSAIQLFDRTNETELSASNQRLALLQERLKTSSGFMAGYVQDLIKAEKVQRDVIQQRIDLERKAAQEKADAQQRENDAIARQNVLKSYIGDSSRMTATQSLAKQIEDENKAFSAATAGFVKESTEYQNALKAHQTAIKKIQDSATPKDKNANQVNDYVKGLVDTYNTLLQATNALNAPQETQIQMAQRLLDSYDGLDAGFRRFIQSQIDLASDNSYIAQFEATQKAAEANAAAIEASAIALEDEVANYGKLPSVITDTTIARLQDKKAIRESFGLVVPEIEDQIAAYQRLRAAQSGKEMIEASKKQQDEIVKAAQKSAEETQRIYERTSDNISRALTDGLMRGFENGKSFAENFKDTLLNIFKTLVLQPIIKFAVDASGLTSFASVLSGVLQGGTSAATGTNGLIATGNGQLGSLGIKDLYTAFTKGIDGLGKSITGGIQDLGVFLSNGNGGLADKIGGFMGQYSQQIGVGLAYLPAAISLIKGDIKGAAFSGAGAAIGSIWGPGGAAIGSALGSLVGGLFGGDKPKRSYANSLGSWNSEDGYIQGQQSTKRGKLGARSYLAPMSNLQEGFSEQLGNYLNLMGIDSNISTYSRFSVKDGGKSKAGFDGSVDGVRFAFSSVYGKKDKEAWSKYVESVLGTVMVRAINASSLESGIKSLFSGMTDKTQVANMMSATVSLRDAQGELADRFGLTVDAAGKVSVATGLAGDNLIEFVKKLASTAQSFQTVGEAMISVRGKLQDEISDVLSDVLLPASLDAFDSILKGLNTSTADGIQQFTDLFQIRDAYSQYIAQFDGIKKGVNDALAGIVSPSEKFAILQDDLQTAFAKLDLAVPGSIDELIALGKSIDYTTEEGLTLAAAFPALVSQFTSTQEATENLISSLGKLDINKFTNMVDYMRAKAYAANGISLSMLPSNLPSFDVGSNYVPYDMTAQIHKGERIFKATDNAALVQAVSQNSTNSSALLEEIRALRDAVSDMQTEMRATSNNTGRTMDILRSVTEDGRAMQTEAVS